MTQKGEGTVDEPVGLAGQNANQRNFDRTEVVDATLASEARPRIIRLAKLSQIKELVAAEPKTPQSLCDSRRGSGRLPLAGVVGIVDVVEVMPDSRDRPGEALCGCSGGTQRGSSRSGRRSRSRLAGLHLSLD